MADRETARLEAAERALIRATDETPWFMRRAEDVLRAADDWDRASGFVTIKLDDTMTKRLQAAIDYPADLSKRNKFYAEPGSSWATAAVLAVLREAAEQ